MPEAALTRSVLLLAAALLAMSGCATSEAEQGPFYTAGRTDGCRTAQERSTSFSTDIFRDETLFETDPSYRAGWRSGYALCGNADGREQGVSRPDLGQWDEEDWRF
jgi:hypothetical protein